MTTVLPAFGRRHRRRLCALALVGVTVTGAALVAGSASAAGAGTLAPYLNCVTADPTGVVTAYFGYDNTTGTQSTIPIGDNNQLFPVSPSQGQPTVFDKGNYPQVFSVTFDPKVFPAVAWILNGQEADASAAGPVCANGVSSPATGITATGATLTGVVVPSGADTTYAFEYGTTTALGSSTPAQDFGTGTQPGLVQTTLSGLAPNTRYYFRITTSSAVTTTQGQTLSFTTATPAVTPTALGIVTTQLGNGNLGAAYQAQVVGRGGTTPYSWSVVKGTLPAGLALNTSTGAISGKPSSAGTSSFTVQLGDHSLPKANTVTRALSLTVNNFKKKAW
ncbi:Ig domain-containing protein [Streptomyces polygonati]|uniref:Ig domain-containing protein n=1 Tax=Streptomyces polygonati TaxID=1617087 RepID=A0ABV8HQ91_9ACTN